MLKLEDHEETVLGAYMWPVYGAGTMQSKTKGKNKEHGIVNTHKKTMYVITVMYL